MTLLQTLKITLKRTVLKIFSAIQCVFTWPSKLGDILLDGLKDDETGSVSSGRIGMMTCLLFSIIVTLMPIYVYVKNPTKDHQVVFSYCQIIALQFLGTAVIFYGAIKGKSVFTSKWTTPKVSLETTLSSTKEADQDMSKDI